MEQNVQTLMDWLNAHVNETIVIEKQELQDLDKVHFNLETVDYRSAEDVIDEYLDSALILRGSGSTLNGAGELVLLPQSNYELAVSGLHIEDSGEHRLGIATDRAKYTLTIA